MNEKMLEEVVRRILGVAQPERIILFGSAALGKATEDSDMDLLVLEQDPGDLRNESIRLRQALRGLDLPIDLVVMGAHRFEETKNVIGGISYGVATRYPSDLPDPTQSEATAAAELARRVCEVIAPLLEA